MQISGLEYKRQLPPPIDLATFYQQKSSEKVHEFDPSIKAAEARANKLRYSLIQDQTPFSERFLTAMEEGELAHHGSLHSRRVEKAQKIALRDIYDDKRKRELLEGENAEADLSALMLFPYFHDLDQQTGNVRNLTREPDKQLKVKKGHGPGASLKILAFTQRYATVNNLTYEEALNITAPAAIMMLPHDKPEAFDKTFSPTNNNAQGLCGNELIAAFEADELNPFSLSAAQIAEITRMTKQKNKFMQDGDSEWGLDPLFEAEYREELEALSCNDIPLLEEMSEKRRERLLLFTESVYFSDMVDMIGPHDLQAMRTFLGQYSQQRDFSVFQLDKADIQDLSVEEYREIRHEAVLNVVKNGNGNDMPTDDTRLLWELLHVRNISAHSDFGDLPNVHKLVKDQVMMSAIFMKELGTHIMQGGDAIDSIINKVYAQRQGKLELQKDKKELAYQIVFNGTYTTQRDTIEEERQEVIHVLKNKHKAYTEEDIADYAKLVDAVIQELRGIYDVDDTQMQEYKEMVDNGIYPSSLPCEYDTLPVNKLVIIG